jgi:antitoxin HicB
MTLLFPVELQPDDNGTLLVTCPSLPEVTTFGESRADALIHARDAIEEALAYRLARWIDIDLPTARDIGDAVAQSRAVRISLLATMKLRLFLACKSEGVTRADLGRRLGWNRESIDRLFRIDHASRIDQIDAAFTALGKAVEVEVEASAA